MINKFTSYLKSILYWAEKELKFIFNTYAMGLSVKSPPIYIVGSAHSGTSLLLAILGAHPNIFPIPFESNIGCLDSYSAFMKIVNRFNRLTIASNKHRWVEKTPRNIHHIGKLLAWTPNAKIIIIVRDGRDVAESIRMRTGDLEHGINIWIDANQEAIKYEHNPSIYIIKYEDIVEDFELAIKGITSFLDEEYHQSMRDFHNIKKRWYSTKIAKPQNRLDGNNHNQYRNWQINQPLFDGRGQQKNLTPKEINLINRKAGSLLKHYGYTDQ